MGFKGASLSGIAFFCLFSFAIFTIDLLYFPAGILLLFPSTRITLLRRKYISYFHGIFASYIAELVVHVCGVKMSLYTDDPVILKEKSNCLVISNHRTRIDWMFSYYYYGVLINMGSCIRIIVKDMLKSLPIYGWAMQHCLYIFLQRSRENDIPHIYNTMSYLLRTSERIALLLFPEGTDLSASNIKKSNAYAAKNGLPEYQHVLHPKSTGLFVALQAMRHHGGCVHDITVAFKDRNDGERPGEKELMLGQFPTEIHIAAERFNFDEIPEEREALDKWVRDRFTKKEKLLESFYNNEPKRVPKLRTEDASSADSELWPKQIRIPSLRSNYLNFGIFFTLQLAVVLSLLFSNPFRWFVALVVISYVVVTSIRGYDQLELLLHEATILQHNPAYSDTGISENKIKSD